MASQAAPELDLTPPVKLSQQTKFMQNYRIASAANAGTEVVTVANGNGDVELFTVGSNGAIWNFYPDPTSDTGYSSANTGLTGTVVSAGVNGAGRIVVFAAQGLVVGYVVETGAAGPQRWSAPATCPVPPPSGAKSIARIDAELIGNHLLVAALVASSSPLGETLYHLVYSDWPASGSPTFNATQVTINTLNAAWTGSTYANAAYTVLDSVIVQFTVSTQQITLPAVAGTFSSIDVDTAVDSSGTNQTFAILNDGNVYHLIGGSNGVPLSWAQLSTLQSFKQLRAVTDDAGAVHVFLLGINNRIYHMEPDTGQMSGYLPPSPIFAGTVQMGVARNANGEIDLFAVGAALNVITHLFEQEASGDWASQRLEVSTGGAVEDFSSYTTDAQVLDAAGAPLANTPVTVWASEETRLTINGSTYFCGPQRPARLNTNDAATVSLAQEVDSLAAPTIFISVPSLMTPGDSVAVEQFTDVQNRLKTTTGNDLLGANDAGGQPILKGQYRTQDTADAVAAAVNNCMSMAVSALRASPSPRYVHAKRSSPGASHHSGDKERATRIHLPSVPQQHWRLSFDGPNARFETLTGDEANVLIMQKRATLVKSMGLFDWLEDVGDFISGVASGIVSIVDTVITTVVNGIKAAITFVVDGVTYLFEAVVHLIEQAIDLAELVFAKVKIFFEQLYEWLAFLFNWKDILRSHEAIAYVMDQMLGFLGGAAAGLEAIVDNGIIALQQNVETWFQNAIQNIAGSQSIGGYSDSNESSSPPGFFSATSNNIIYNHVIDNGSSAVSAKAMMRLQELDAPIQDFLTKLYNLADFTKSTQAFQRALSYFENLGGSPDQIFKQGLAGLMSVAEGLVQAILSGVRLVIDALFELIQAVVKILRDALNAEWDIPFVTQFYHWITDGSPLTTLDLIALIVAIPTTVFYKALKGATPFPDGASVDAFKAAFNAQTMLAASGLGPKKKAARRPQAGVEDAAFGGMFGTGWATFCAAGGMMAGFFSYGFSAVLDLADPLGDKPAKWVTYTAFVAECIQQGCGFPWFYTAGAPSCDDADGRGKVLWIIQCIGIAIDAIFIYADEVMPENAKDPGVTVSLIYAVCHFGAAIGGSVGASGVAVAANILAVVPELAKFLRYEAIVVKTGKGSLWALAGIEALVGITAAGCGLGAALETINASKSQAEPLRLVAAN